MKIIEAANTIGAMRTCSERAEGGNGHGGRDEREGLDVHARAGPGAGEENEAGQDQGRTTTR